MKDGLNNNNEGNQENREFETNMVAEAEDVNSDYEIGKENLDNLFSETVNDISVEESDDKTIIYTNNKQNKILIGIVAFLGILVILLMSYIVYTFIGKGNLFGINSNNSNSESTKTSEYKEDFGGKSPVELEPLPENKDGYTDESIYEQVADSVVGVVVYDTAAGIISDPVAEGSGFVFNENGYIITNAHVVGNSKDANIKVVLRNGDELPAKVVGYDSVTKTDIAVIKVDRKGLKAVTFGNSDDVKVGASVLAIGNPLGLRFASSMAKGIVSGVNRTLSDSQKSLVKFIQTDAAINHGNSGGPLVNKYAQVIGITSCGFSSSDGIDGMKFAIPSNTVKTIVDDIIEKGYVSGRVRLGISGKMVSNYQSQIYGVPMGIVVAEISKDSNLAHSGIQVGDIITKINDVSITSSDAFYGELYTHKPSETVKLTIYRPTINRLNSSTFEVDVALLEDKGETQVSTEKTILR